MYKIVGADGKEYGPIPFETVRQWVSEGRANAQTRVQAAGSTDWKPLAEFPELVALLNQPAPGLPPAAPTMAPISPGPSAQAPDLVNGPAIGLIVTGALCVLFAGFRAIAMVAGFNPMRQMGGSQTPTWAMGMAGAAGAGIAIVGVVCGLVILYGGVKMRSLQSYGLCMTASILAMIPCTSSVCCLIGLPIGIWALVVLSKPEVKSAFH
jgi:hypothetical protein